MTSTTYSPVADFYTGKTLLITGSTGLIGKVLLEKILYSVPEVKRIYILLREKRGVTASDRLDKLIGSPVFARIGRINQNILKAKIVAIHGDLTKNDLDLDDADRALIVSQVNIVFHCAASIRFDDPVHEALKPNFLGTKSVAQLCHEIRDLEAFIHVSTCYSNAHLAELEEKVYKTKVTGEQLMEMSRNMTQGQLDRHARAHLFEGRPNSYTFTKALAENHVADTCQDLPAAIVRLPIVVPPLAEPEPCFADTIGAANFLAFATLLGILRSYRYRPPSIIQVLPVDHAVSGLILVGRELALAKRSQVKIINMALGEECKVTIGGYLRRLHVAVAQKGFSYKRIRPLPNVARPAGTLERQYKKYVLEYFYSFLVDCVYVILGKKPNALNNVKQASIVRDSLEYFMFHSPLMRNDNYQNLANSLDAKDKKTFNIRIHDVTRIFDDRKKSLSYISDCVTSYMKYKFNETVTPESLAKRKKYIEMLRYKETFAIILVHAILGGLFYLTYCCICLTLTIL